MYLYWCYIETTIIVFAWFVPSCQQVWNKLLATCNKLVNIVTLVTRLLQQVRYSRAVIVTTLTASTTL